MATEEVGELRRGDGAGAHAGDLVGGDGDADARAAHAHATVGVAGGHAAGDLLAVVGVIAAGIGIGTEVDDLVAELVGDIGLEHLLLLKARVV